MKTKKIKFFRNIIIGIIALFIAAFIINIAPGYKRDKYQTITNLVIGDENVTEKLKNSIYIDNEEGIYISEEDIKQLFDSSFYYDEKEDRIITTSNLSVASMKIGAKQLQIDNSLNATLYTVIYKEGIRYIPIQEMELVYNIDVKYVKEKNIVIIDKLNKGLIKAEVYKNSEIRFKPRGLSKKVGELEVGDNVSAFYTTSKGWRLIRTEDGTIGYVKANVLTNEYIVRQDMEQNVETKNITIDINNGSLLDIEGEKILIQDLLKMSNEGILLKNVDYINTDDRFKVWANLTIENVDLEDYYNRTKLIKNVVSIAVRNNINGINIISNSDINIDRLVIELAPRLRQAGITTNIVINNQLENTEQEKYIEKVDYIISEK